MRVQRAAFPIALIVLSVSAFALPQYVKDFKSTYSLKPGTALAKAGCVICHVSNGSPKLNPYGADLAKAMKEEKAGKLLKGSVLKKVEGLDSDKDGVKNLDEIKKGTLPGDPKSK